MPLAPSALASASTDGGHTPVLHDAPGVVDDGGRRNGAFVHVRRHQESARQHGAAHPDQVAVRAFC